MGAKLSDKKLIDFPEFTENSLCSKFNSSSTSSSNARDYSVFEYKSSLAFFNSSDLVSETSFIVAAKTIEEAETLLVELLEIIPDVAPLPNTKTYINFWYMSGQGPGNIRRSINVPSWEEIENNYNEDNRQQISDLMEIETGDDDRLTDGQLILWQGDPGTGKTYAIRALARNWREWAEFHYITDPDKFFGSSADYMMSVIMSSNDGMVVGSSNKWKVLILEDSGELLAADAKQNVGQALSRLLNVVDGLIGQSLRLMILITTNEEMTKLHPAVSRHGRCASKICFKDLSQEESNQWLEDNGSDLEVDSSKQLCELYSLVSENKISVENNEKVAKVAIGFS